VPNVGQDPRLVPAGASGSSMAKAMPGTYRFLNGQLGPAALLVGYYKTVPRLPTLVKFVLFSSTRARTASTCRPTWSKWGFDPVTAVFDWGLSGSKANSHVLPLCTAVLQGAAQRIGVNEGPQFFLLMSCSPFCLTACRRPWLFSSK
jgi:hypothetical protein